MKKQTSTLFGYLDKSNLATLTAEVNETIAFSAPQLCEKTFTAADLWHIQSQVKTRNTKRYF